MIKANIRTATTLAMLDLKHKSEIEQVQLIEHFILLQIGLNSQVNSELRDLNYMIRQEPTLYRHEAKRIVNQIDSDIRQMEASLTSTLLYNASACNRDGQSLLKRMEDATLSSDCVLFERVKELRDYFLNAMPKAGDCCPAQPKLVAQIMVCQLLTAVASLTYNRGKDHDFPLLKQKPLYDYLDHFRTVNRLYRLREILPLKSYRGNPLQFNFYGMMNRTEVTGEKNAQGRWENGILPKLRNTVYSSAFLDRLYLVRDGVDYHFRDRAPSLFSNMIGDSTIEVVTDFGEDTENKQSNEL